jgi:hypothetical protein
MWQTDNIMMTVVKMCFRIETNYEQLYCNKITENVFLNRIFVNINTTKKIFMPAFSMKKKRSIHKNIMAILEYV